MSLAAGSAALAHLVAALDLASFDLAAPAARRRAARFDVFLEAAKVALDLPLDEAQRIARLLDDTFRLDLEFERHARPRSADRLEADAAVVLRSARRVPGDDRVGFLLADLCTPRAVDAIDLRVPREGGVVELLDAPHAVHEPWELLELGPLVIGDADGDFDIGGFDDLRHKASPFA